MMQEYLGTKFLDEISAWLCKLDDHWKEFDAKEFGHVESEALQKLCYSGLVEQRLQVTCESSAVNQRLELTVTGTGVFENKLYETFRRLIPGVIDGEGRWEGHSQHGAKSLFAVRLTNNGHLAKEDVIKVPHSVSYWASLGNAYGKLTVLKSQLIDVKNSSSTSILPKQEDHPVSTEPEPSVKQNLNDSPATEDDLAGTETQEPNETKSEETSTSEEPLGERARNVLIAMLELEAIDSDSLESSDDISKEALGGTSGADAIKNVMPDLKARDLIKTKTGRRVV